MVKTGSISWLCNFVNLICCFQVHTCTKSPLWNISVPQPDLKRFFAENFINFISYFGPLFGPMTFRTFSSSFFVFSFHGWPLESFGILFLINIILNHDGVMLQWRVVNFQNLRIIIKKLSAEWSRIHSTFSWFIIDNEVNVVIPTFEWILSNIIDGPVRRGIHFDPVKYAIIQIKMNTILK